MKLVVKNIQKSFSQRKIFKDISFVVNGGESLAITGSNGSGKTTLIRVLCALTRAVKVTMANKKMEFTAALERASCLISFKKIVKISRTNTHHLIC